MRLHELATVLPPLPFFDHQMNLSGLPRAISSQTRHCICVGNQVVCNVTQKPYPLVSAERGSVDIRLDEFDTDREIVAGRLSESVRGYEYELGHRKRGREI